MYLFLFSLCSLVPLKAQQQPEGSTITLIINGVNYKAIVTPEGDTMILADLDDVNVVSTRTFEKPEDQQKYDKFRRYAHIVFPYAKEAIRIFREMEYAEQYMTKKERKRKIKELDKQLTQEFEEPLKKLTKLQGKIMVKMIEKELDRSMYELIKEIKGGFTAFYWNGFSKLYSYDLKEGYHEGMYPVLDAVLVDFDLGYRIENESSMKYINVDQFKNKIKK
jgi:hypothetical protein